MNGKYRVLQDDLKDCGVCALLSIIKYYNGNVSKEYLREITNTTKNGVSALNLIKGARELGFESYGVKGKITNISCNLLPLIAHVVIDKKFPHFIVVYKIDLKRNRILVMDPAKGFKYFNVSDFIKMSSNYYLIMKPKKKLPCYNNKLNYLKKIKDIVLDKKAICLIIIILSLIYTLINILDSYHFKFIYEDSALNIFVVLNIFIVIKNTVNYCRNYLLVLFNNLLDKYLVKDAVYHIIHLPYLYYSTRTNGDLLTRINDLGNIKNLLGNLFISVFVDLILAIAVLVFMINISIKLSIISIITLFMYSIVVFINSKNIEKNIRDSYENSSLVNNNLYEVLSSFETIKNLSIQKYIFNVFASKYDQYSENNKRLFKNIQFEILFKNIILEFGNLLIIFLGVKMINNNILSVVSLVTFITLSNYLTEPIKKLLDLHLEYENAKESIRRIKDIYTIPEEKTITNHVIKYLHGDININNLIYSYDGINNVINNLSLNILEGEKVLMYGNSGNGKSTLIKILIKYLDNNYRGNITIGGYDLDDIDISSLRNNICYVSQNEFLYTDSVYENITLGKKIKYKSFLNIVNNLSIKEIVKNSSLGFNMGLENNGDNISGGERKRILVARSILQKANVYIYDETFSEMDIQLERKILKYLFQIFNKKTIIVISHRFSNEDLFDKKIEIGGEIVGQK